MYKLDKKEYLESLSEEERQVYLEEEEYLDSLSEEERQEYLEEYYADLEVFEQREKEKLDIELYNYVSEDGEEYKIPMNIIGVDGIGLRANVKDMDKFINYLITGVTRRGKIFSHEKNRHNLCKDTPNKFFKGIGFYGAVWMEFYENPYRSDYNVTFTIFPRKLNTTPHLKEQVMDEFLNYFDKDTWNIYRLDIDFTMFKDLSTYYFHKKYTQKFEVITRTKFASDSSVESVEIYDDPEIFEDVETRYIGNRRSADFYIRLYNKKKLVEKNIENDSNKKFPKAFPHLSRLEIEIKKEGLKRWKDCLENLTLKRPNYWDSNDLSTMEKIKIAGFLTDNRLFSLVSQNTRDKFRKMIDSLENSDDIINQLEKEFKMSHQSIINTVKEWTGQNIDY